MHRGTQLSEVVKELGQRGIQDINIALTGTISSVDPETYTAKVLLGMLGRETGWLPIGSLIAGNGYGILALPDDGAEVTVIFESGDLNAGKILLCNFNQEDPPPQRLNQGEILLQAKSSSSIKLSKDGTVTIETNSANINLTQLQSGGSINLTTSAVNVIDPITKASRSL